MNRIKEVPEEKGIEQFAEKLGMSFGIVNTYACNRRQPNLGQFSKSQESSNRP